MEMSALWKRLARERGADRCTYFGDGGRPPRRSPRTDRYGRDRSEASGPTPSAASRDTLGGFSQGPAPECPRDFARDRIDDLALIQRDDAGRPSFAVFLESHRHPAP